MRIITPSNRAQLRSEKMCRGMRVLKVSWPGLTRPPIDRIGRLCLWMDCRVKPGNDGEHPCATQARPAHGSPPLEPGPGDCSNRRRPRRLPRSQGGQISETAATTMTDIRYLAPRTLDEAISAFAAAGTAARILAGGTDLLVQMRAGSVRPGLIVDIKKIAEMTTIEEAADGGFRVGAAVPGAVLAEHGRFGKAWPGVLETVNLIGSTQVHGLASPGGHLGEGVPAPGSGPLH